MEIKDTLVIASEFVDNPGARDRDDGPHSGQEFLEDLLLDRFNKAVEGNYILQIDLDGVWGFPSSFISGSFGVLSMTRGSAVILKHLSFKSSRGNLKIEKITNEIKNPTPKIK